MTGYGEAEGQIDDVTYRVEIRTINSRYFKARLKMPDPLLFIEDDIDKLLTKNISRGTVNCILTFKNAPSEVLFNIDEAALRENVERLYKILHSCDINWSVDVGNLLTLPGVMLPCSLAKEDTQRVREGVLQITENAIARLKEMRASEGSALADDLGGHCETMKQKLNKIRSQSENVPKEYQKKLQKRVEELLVEVDLQIDDTTLAREVAVFAEKSDISEELARLDSHVKHFEQTCQQDGQAQAGRKLDFISQEMLREANTIASKTADLEIISLVVDVKCAIDRLKEQVQNIE